MSDGMPGFQGFMRPLLEVLERESAPLRARDAYEKVADAVGLTPAQRAITLPSGKQPAYCNRIGWARTYLSFAGLIDMPSRGQWRLSEEGRKFLRSHVGPVDLRVLQKVPAFRERKESQRLSETDGVPTEESRSNASTPEEQLAAAHAEIRSSVADDLASLLQRCSPGFFELTVLDLLGRMGYGTDDDARQRVGRTGDGGIDGIISLDKLGLERVYIQAKRWDLERPVGPKEIREFYGSLAERKASKGVFMTTSRYTRDAEAFARNVSGSLILIDGTRLVSLMIEHGVGVSVAQTLRVPKVDRDYFDE